MQDSLFRIALSIIALFTIAHSINRQQNPPWMVEWCPDTFRIALFRIALSIIALFTIAHSTDRQQNPRWMVEWCPDTFRIALLRFPNSMKLISTQNRFHLHVEQTPIFWKDLDLFSSYLYNMNIYAKKIGCWRIICGRLWFWNNLNLPLEPLQKYCLFSARLGIFVSHKKIFIGQTRIKELIFWTWQPLVSPQDDSHVQQFWRRKKILGNKSYSFLQTMLYNAMLYMSKEMTTINLSTSLNPHAKRNGLVH